MIKVANAPCSWGVLEFDLEGEAAGYEQVLNEMIETGYAGTELGDWGFMPTDPKLLAEVGVPEDHELLAPLIFGYPAEKPAQKQHEVQVLKWMQ